MADNQRAYSKYSAGLAITNSYPTSAIGIIVLLKTPPKYSTNLNTERAYKGGVSYSREIWIFSEREDFAHFLSFLAKKNI